MLLALRTPSGRYLRGGLKSSGGGVHERRWLLVEGWRFELVRGRGHCRGDHTGVHVDGQVRWVVRAEVCAPGSPPTAAAPHGHVAEARRTPHVRPPTMLVRQPKHVSPGPLEVTPIASSRSPREGPLVGEVERAVRSLDHHFITPASCIVLGGPDPSDVLLAQQVP